VARIEAVELAEMLELYYETVHEIVTRHRGRVVKFMGDGTLAVFPPEDCPDAVRCAFSIAAIDEPAASLRAGVNVHMAQVAEAWLPPDGRYDVVGMGVNHVFLMGRGPGIRISEPVYRALPHDERGRWTKHRPPATYTYA
jgi:class 3 adenylate cyclase